MAILGLVDGGGDAIVSISQAPSGYISDRVGKRRIFIYSDMIGNSTVAVCTRKENMKAFLAIEK